MALTFCGPLMPTVAAAMGGWDRRLAYQIFICLLCSVQILWTGKMHYVCISARAASDKYNWTLWTGKQICFVFRERHAACVSYDKFWLAKNSEVVVDVK